MRSILRLKTTSILTHPHMNLTNHYQSYPDDVSIPTELSFEGSWDGDAVSELIRAKCESGAPPAFLFLGKKETRLLKEHLSEVFGSEAVITINGTRYKGLEVVPLQCESFLIIGGHKAARSLLDPMSRPAWRDRDTDALWQFRI